MNVMDLKVRANIAKNRLHFTIAGKASKADLDKLYTDVRFCVADLKPGFDVITDLSQCTLAHLTGVPTFIKIMNFLIANDVGNVVRIINGNSVIFKQVLNISTRICSYKPIYVSTLEEAEEKLEGAVKRNSIRFQINELAVRYSAHEIQGEGNIYNLSTSGCAIESATTPISVDDEISITFAFKRQAAPADEFIIQAKVVRAESKTFAVAFKDFEDVQKEKLWECLLNEAQRIA